MPGPLNALPAKDQVDLRVFLLGEFHRKRLEQRTQPIKN